MGCPTGTGRCSLTPSTVLAPGNGQWWVQTWNNCGYGPWSDGRAFSVTVWPMFGHDPSHTRRSPYKGPSSPNHILLIQTGGSVYSSPAIGPDGRIYVGSSDHKLYAFKTVYSADGVAALVLDGVCSTGGSVYSSPAVGPDGTIYVGSSDKVYAVKTVYSADGAAALVLDWVYPTGSSVYSSPAVGPDGTVYVGSYNGKVYALNGANGSKRWEYTTGGGVDSSPAIGSDGTLYFGAFNGKLYAVNGTTGVKLWEYQTGGGLPTTYIHSSPAIAANGTLYVGSSDRRLYAFLILD